MKRSQRAFSIVLTGAACLAGCSKPQAPLPKTYPVYGRVTDKKGLPIRGGFVQFHPEAERSVTTTGAIQSDGTYRLKTMRSKLSSDGAVAGANRVSIVAPTNTGKKDEMGGLVSVVYPKPYTVEQHDNEINLKFDR
jgi:hypothetical protein